MKPCKNFTGYIDRNGYGICQTDRGAGPTSTTAHRRTYEAVYGFLPGDLEVDHLCNNRSCIELTHLEAVTRAENARRASVRQTHCINGHLYDEENTCLDTDGYRYCRTCANLGNRDRRRLERLERGLVPRLERTGCPHQHGPYDGVYPKSGWRYCKTCQRESARRRRSKGATKW